MKRVMVVGGPGAGKSTFARALGDATGLPVVHIDLIHWQPGWRERSRDEKTRMCLEVEARDAWIFEGGHSATWTNRAARADTLIWLDLPIALRLWRVLKRIWQNRIQGRLRPDLPADCPERLDLEFLRYIIVSRRGNRAKAAALQHKFPHLDVHRLSTVSAVQTFLETRIQELSDADPAY